MRRIKGFTLIELMVVISIIVMLIGILLPSLGRARITARRMQGATQVRGIQQSMVTFAQSNNNNYPGRNSTGATVAEGLLDYTGAGLDGDSVEGRFGVMLDESLVPPELLVSPADTGGKVVYTTGAVVAGVPTNKVASTNYSYSMSHIDAAVTPGQRRVEWTDTTNSSAIVVGDRLTGTSTAATPAQYDSIYAENGWEGNLGYNDNHVTYFVWPSDGTVVSGLNTRYGTSPEPDDDPFSQTDFDDALLIGAGKAMVHGTNITN